MSVHIVAIHAHPDDLEILAAGTLALLAQKGHRITMVTMTPGDKGSDQLPPQEIAAVRRQEAHAAASLIGASYACLEFRDLEIFETNESRKKVVEAIRKLKPDLVITSSPVDYLCDHEVTSRLVRDALFAAQAPNYITGDPDPAPALTYIPHLYFVDPVEGVDREGRPVKPDFIVNISSTFAVKREMLAKHQSQREWLLRHHGMDNYLATMEQWSRLRGSLAGIPFGEGFRQYRGHPYPRSPRLQELLGREYVIELR